MRSVILSGYQITDRQDLHRQLSRVLELPDWYGGNLDALMDCLRETGEETVLRVIGFGVLERRLGECYAHALRRVLLRAGEENPNLRVEWE